MKEEKFKLSKPTKFKLIRIDKQNKLSSKLEMLFHAMKQSKWISPMTCTSESAAKKLFKLLRVCSATASLTSHSNVTSVKLSTAPSAFHRTNKLQGNSVATINADLKRRTALNYPN